MKEQTTKQLINRSTRAFCGMNEREVTVATKNVDKAVRKLRNAGYYIVGTSYGKTNTKKVWFNPAGSLI